MGVSLFITIHRTRNAHGYHIVGVSYDTGLVGLINGNSISIKVLDYKGFPLYV